MNVRLLLALIVSLVSFSFATPVVAQNAGFSLIPTLIEEAADPGQVLSGTIQIKNLSDNRETYYLDVRDIVGTTDNGRPIYRNDRSGVTELDLSSWITFNQTEVTLAPGAEQLVSYVIRVPENAPPGGHFAGIFGSINPQRPDVEGVGAAVGYQVGNIINIRVSGDVDEEAVVRSLRTDKYWYGSKDVTFTAKIENLGNVLVRPSGPITITNMLGDKVAEVTMNDANSGIYPNSIRDISATWSEPGLGFGRYTANMALLYGIEGEARYTITANNTFWILPWEILQPLLISLAVLALLSYVLVRYYITQQVRKLSGGRRLVRSTGPAGPSPLVLAAIVTLFMSAFVLFVLLLIFA